MSKRAKIILIVIAVLFIVALLWFFKKNQKSIVQFETETPFKTTIVKKTVATGKVIPLEEAIKKLNARRAENEKKVTFSAFVRDCILEKAKKV